MNFDAINTIYKVVGSILDNIAYFDHFMNISRVAGILLWYE
jgi:hypothetical protein